MFSTFLVRGTTPPAKAARRLPNLHPPLSLDTSKARDLEESMFSIFYISTPLLSLDRILEESMFSIFLVRGTTPLTKAARRLPSSAQVIGPSSSESSAAVAAAFRIKYCIY